MARGRPLAAALACAVLAAALQASSWGAKPFGVLLIGATGSSAGGKGLGGLREALKGKFPVEFAFGLGDFKEIQKGIDRLSAQGVKKLVVIPLVLTSESPAIEETKYVLGMRKDPDPEFFKGGHSSYTNVRRAQTKLPLVMTSALDDHQIVADILAARAKEMSEHPERERVVLIGRGAGADTENDLVSRHLASLAAKVQASGNYAEAHGFVLRDEAPREKRDEVQKKLRKSVALLSRSGRVIIVPYLLATDGTERTVRKVLDGLFYVFNGKGLMPDPRLAKWVEDKANEAAALPNMRQHKDAGRPLPPADRKKLIQTMSLGRAAPPRHAPKTQTPGEKE